MRYRTSWESSKEEVKLYEKKLFDAIERAGKISGVWKIDPNYKWDLKSATDLFQGVFNFFGFRSSKSGTFDRRFEALSWMTIYNQYVQNGKRLAGEQEVNTTQQTLVLFECSTINIKL